MSSLLDGLFYLRLHLQDSRVKDLVELPKNKFYPPIILGGPVTSHTCSVIL
jgi:hypothetical protein